LLVVCVIALLALEADAKTHGITKWTPWACCKGELGRYCRHRKVSVENKKYCRNRGSPAGSRCFKTQTVKKWTSQCGGTPRPTKKPVITTTQSMQTVSV